LRVLLLHNRYRAPGGEERAVADQAALLARHGHEVRTLERSSERLSKVRAGASLLAGGWRPEEIARAVRRTGVQVVHAHNVHPLLGWRALAAARAQGAATVLQLHNFRLFCAIAVAYRDGAPCFRCRAGRTWPGLALRCRDSLPEAAVYAAGLARQQRRLIDSADRLLVLSAAHGEQLHALGLPRGAVDVLPNFLPTGAFARDSAADAGRYALCAGRLVEEKGFDTAIRAARAAAVPLIIAGSGPDEARLRALAAGGEVQFRGWMPPGELAALRRGAATVLVPSRCWEACPYALLESLAAGVPVLVSDRGGSPELAPAGSALPAEDERAWAHALRELWQAPGLRLARGRDGLALARERHGEEGYHARLLESYAAAAG
jgi:glycosyltransferase involved in cell wall biosynthesis